MSYTNLAPRLKKVLIITVHLLLKLIYFSGRILPEYLYVAFFLYKVLVSWLVGFMVFNATFNNISVILWRSVLLVEETRENHWPAVSHWQTLSHNVVFHTLSRSRTHNISGDRHRLHRSSPFKLSAFNKLQYGCKFELLQVKLILKHYLFNMKKLRERSRPMKGWKRPTLRFLLNHDNQFNKEITDVKTASESNIWTISSFWGKQNVFFFSKNLWFLEINSRHLIIFV